MKFLLSAVLLWAVCVPGLQAQDDPDCWTFRARGRLIKNKGLRFVRNVETEEECAQLCVDEPEFDCASLNYKIRFKKCILMTATRETAGDAYGPQKGSTYRERTLPCGEPCELLTPCLNGGECVNTNDTYTCICSERFSGSECQNEVVPCESNPCQNGALCINAPDVSYSCQCASGFVGFNCEEEFNPCDSNPCQNDGSCAMNPDFTFICLCSEGYAGVGCEEEVPPCSSNPCQNGGLCVNEPDGTFICQCGAGYSGQTCQERVDPCASNPCQNGGQCAINPDYSYVCYCDLQFTGLQCEEEVPACNSSPCQGASTCINNADGSYACQCPSMYTGLLCESRILACDMNPCQYGATCKNTNHGPMFLCLCTPAHSGPKCERENPTTNIAFKKKTSAISQGWPYFSAAVDGDTNPDYWQWSCGNSQWEVNPWMAVDLGESQPIAEVMVTNRYDCCDERLNDVVVYTGDIAPVFGNKNLDVSAYQECDRVVGSFGQGATRSFLCDSVTARYVILYHLSPRAMMMICELQVFSAL